jgi:hypothetical protein
VARLFGGVNTDRVLVSPAAALNTLSAFSVGIMAYPSALASNTYFCAKYDLAGTAGWLFLITGTDKPAMLVKRATTDVTYASSVALALLTWQTIVITVNLAASPVVHIYQGALGSDLAEPAYGTATDGSGAQKDDSAGGFAVGNGTWAGATSAQSGILGNAFVVDRVLTLQDAQEYHKGRLPLPYRPLIHFPLWGVSATEPDTSRNSFSGAVTGTVGPIDNPPQMKWRPSSHTAGLPSSAILGGHQPLHTRRRTRT